MYSPITSAPARDRSHQRSFVATAGKTGFGTMRMPGIARENSSMLRGM